MLTPFTGEDGSQSFFNTDFNEAYHSKIGPILEATHKFVNPSCLEEYIRSGKKVKILDLFFGLGYNTGVALKTAYKLSSSPEMEILGIESDLNIIQKIKELSVPEHYKKWKELLSKLEITNKIKFDKTSITLKLEDINSIIEELPKNYFDIIFFDPFSHKRCSGFWSESFLTTVFKLLAPNGTFTTYSGLKRVKQLAENRGLVSKFVEPLGRKKPSLLIKSVAL